MGFIPHLFIGVGATGAFFTLRETYQHEIYVPGAGSFGNSVVNGEYQGSVHTETRSFHICNLSQDPDEAIAKAKKYSEKLATPFFGTRETLTEQMREIARASREEVERRAREQKELEDRWAAERAERRKEQIDLLYAGIISFGRYRDKEFAAVPSHYLQWLVEGTEDFDQESLPVIAGGIIAKNYSYLLPIKPSRDMHFGAIGEREEVTVTVYSIKHFTYSNGWDQGIIATLVTEAGACLICFGQAGYDMEEGQKLRIKATVKDHSEYRGQSQTIVNRIKILEVLDAQQK